jgi:hypothetical protein
MPAASAGENVSFRVNRLDAPRERLGAAPDGIGRTLGDLVALLHAT